MGTQTVDLSIVIVSWNVKALLRECLRSLLRAPGWQFGTAAFPSDQASSRTAEIWVVDSASSDGTAEMVRDEFPGVGLIASIENVGFTKGNNLGIAQCSGRYVMLLNPDTEITGDALDVLVGWLDTNPDVGVVGPCIVQPDGEVQPSRRRFPTFGTAFMESTILQQWFPRNRSLARYYMWDQPDDQVQDVDWLEGACLVVRDKTLRGVGGFDERFFMYSEELDLCRRIKQAGWRIVYLPSARILHHGGKSSEQVVASKHIRFQRSKIAYYSKWFGAFRGQMLRAFLLAMYAWMLGVESLKWLVGHRRELRAPRIAAYRQVIASRLR
jgi:N-acetylglucosaminyl-diphospho-decaprenol L-rhamnosyltransferase